MISVLNQMVEPEPDELAYFQRRDNRGFNYHLFMQHVKQEMAIGDVVFPRGLFKHTKRYGNTDPMEEAERQLVMECNQSVVGWKRRRMKDSRGYCYEKTQNFN